MSLLNSHPATVYCGHKRIRKDGRQSEVTRIWVTLTDAASVVKPRRPKLYCWEFIKCDRPVTRQPSSEAARSNNKT